jgi:hypothetical protein
MGLGSDAPRFTVRLNQSAYNAPAAAKGGGPWPHGPVAVFSGLDDSSP